MVKSVNRKLLFDTHAIVRLLEESGENFKVFWKDESYTVVSIPGCDG